MTYKNHFWSLFGIIILLSAPTIFLSQLDFDLQGHRGARALKPENTLPSFETALDLEVTTLELDLHLSKDGEVVIWHDDEITSEKCKLDSTSTIVAPDPNGNFRDNRLMLRQLTVEQLKAYRCDLNPDAVQFPDQDNAPTSLAGDNYTLITLNELFEFVADYSVSDEKTVSQRQNAEIVQFNIETKRKADVSVIGDDFDGVNPGEFERAILHLITTYDLEDRIILQSFDHRSLWAVHRVNPQIRLAALTSRSIPNLADLAEQGATIWSPNYQDLTPQRIQQAHNLGLFVIPWTVNEIETIQALISIGVDGIITDHPNKFRSLSSEL